MKKSISKLFTGLVVLVTFLQYFLVGTYHAQNVLSDSNGTHVVEFVVNPENADVSVTNKDGQEVEPEDGNQYLYRLEEGEYSYTASLNGYTSIENEKFTVGKTDQKIEVTLTKSDEKVAVMAPENLRAPLSLDNVTITEFKIIDVANGNKEIDYRLSDSGDFESFKADPSQFKNAIFEGQKDSIIKLKLSVEYAGNKVFSEGDTLVIPAKYGGIILDFNPQPLLDKTNHEIGTWEYKNGNIIITFGGDYIKKNQVTNFVASFETGNIKNSLGFPGASYVLGERAAVEGVLGKNKIVVPFEKRFVLAKELNVSKSLINKAFSRGNDKEIRWSFNLQNDYFLEGKDIYINPHMLENNGEYKKNSYTDIYLEDTFNDVIKEPEIKLISVSLTGINDEGKVISGNYTVGLDVDDAFVKKNQESLTKEEVKANLKAGEYCFYKNDNGTYTLMMKLWNMNEGTGLTYDKIPRIKAEGGVGNYLKSKAADIFGGLKPDTIKKINDIYKGKAIQFMKIYVDAEYTPVFETTLIHNSLNVSTAQTGKEEKEAIGTLTPPAGVADAPSKPLTFKLVKTDVRTGDNLSDGFKFKLQTSTDGGNAWTDVNIEQGNLEIGTLNDDKSLTPVNGEIQVKGLTGNQKYRFFETAHPDGYMDVAENAAEPNTAKNPTSANSRAIDITNQGKGQVVIMYNKKKVEKININVTKVWEGIDGDKPTISLQLMKNGQPEGQPVEFVNGKTAHQFTDLPKTDDAGTPYEYSVKEVGVDQGFITLGENTFKVTYGGDVQNGLTVTNTKQDPLTPLVPPTIDIQVTKEWAMRNGAKAPVDQIEVVLYKDGKETPNRLFLEKSKQWKAKFTGLELSETVGGKEFEYTVKEVGENNNSVTLEGKEFKVSYSGDAENGLKITNRELIPWTPIVPPTIDIQVTKEWAMRNGAKVPVDQIEVELYKDGVATGNKLVLKESEQWTAKFTGVAMRENLVGKDYLYTVKEVGEDKGSITLGVKEFTVFYSGTMADGLVIKNEEKPFIPPVIPPVSPTPDPKPIPDPKPTPDPKPIPDPKPTPNGPNSQPNPKLEFILPKTGTTSNWTAYGVGGLLIVGAFIAVKAKRTKR